MSAVAREVSAVAREPPNGALEVDAAYTRVVVARVVAAVRARPEAAEEKRDLTRPAASSRVRPIPWRRTFMPQTYAEVPSIAFTSNRWCDAHAESPARGKASPTTTVEESADVRTT